MPMPMVTVITAHAGNPLLKRRARESVRDQSYENVQHLVVADGPATWAHARSVLDAVENHRVSLILLPYSIGRDRWNGHRIDGAGTYIADGEYLVFQTMTTSSNASTCSNAWTSAPVAATPGPTRCAT